MSLLPAEHRIRALRLTSCAIAAALACAPARQAAEAPVPQPNIDSARTDRRRIAVPAEATAAAPVPEDSAQPVAPPELAFAQGWMALASSGVDRFLTAHPDYDGRGVVIGILDTGIDPGVSGLTTTSTGAPKILDLRDFSDEGAVPLTPVTPRGDSIEIAGQRLGGVGRLLELSPSGPYYGGIIAEIPLGEPPASDLNGNGAVADTLPLVVTRAPDGWVVLADTDGDGSLAEERPVHDYLVAPESFGWAPRSRRPGAAVAVNIEEAAGQPRLDLVFDISGHGTHVAGIAAAHDLYQVAGFDGVAPGAQLLGLKIANSALGSVTTTGSMLRAMDYAIRFAEARGLPLVLNLSFGVGNEIEGGARIDALVDSVLARHPDVVMTVSAGNDGPGLSTMGFPASAGAAITVGALFPGSFLPPSSLGARASDQLAYFSSRGAELAKPELVTPGVAYSAVPRWKTGHEVEQGTSMAAPHAAGLAALLVSALAQERKPILARTIKQALMVTATPDPGGGFIDAGVGRPDLGSAYRWLQGAHPAPDVVVRAVGPGDATAAFTRMAAPAGDTVQTFELRRPRSAPVVTVSLRSDAPWLIAPAGLTLSGGSTRVELRYARRGLTAPGVYTGVVSGWGEDSLAGPLFRLVNTLVVPAPVAATAQVLRSEVWVAPGDLLRTYFLADSARPLSLAVSTGSPGERTLAFLHEPGGMPFRDQATRTAGFGPQNAEYEVDARDVVGGAYESVVAAPPAQAIVATVTVTHSPVTLRAVREPDSVRATFANVTDRSITAQVGLHLGGAERDEAVTASGSDSRRIPFVVPAWSRGVVIDVTMDRAQWGRFTDFGVTLLDSVGRQLGKQPLNYAFGRLEVELPEGHGAMPVTLLLSPGFADPEPADPPPWSLRAAIRLYADSSVVLAPADSEPVVLPPGRSWAGTFALTQQPWPLDSGFSLLGLLVTRIEDHSWTREVPLGPAPVASPP